MAPTTLASLTTLRLGGPADRVLVLSDPTDWPDIVRAVHEQGERAPVVLGHGSNVIASDAGYPGTVVVVNTRGIAAERAADSTVAVTVQAGHPLTDLVSWAAAEHLAGIECLAGIPGTTGAAPVQNTGAYGQQLADTLDYVTAWDWQTNRLLTLPAHTCRLGYRHSRFKVEIGRWTVLSVTLHLTRTSQAAPVTYQHLAAELGVPIGACPTVSEVTAAVLTNRHRRGLLLNPHNPEARQVGSVFLNPRVTPVQAHRWSAAGCPAHRDTDGQLRASAGWMLEHAGFRPGDTVVAGVRCSAYRSLTLVADHGATAAGFTKALLRLTGRVAASTGITLRPEPTAIGLCKQPSEWCPDSGT
ncbi:UDP-N-acetylmuramate dehydrogenase [Kitasatospora sp. NBC_01302]|uniref:UDP-N-acetylmuramate dehydrogenase n=1 Tax=Kitasatospora sp. NBC_01302 TaxID=2903575 RepID=UPI002E11DAB7|nr:UDP-N-acetylmuramate dehydrogenase [Kitasatospora sp. NBC_01302]